MGRTRSAAVIVLVVVAMVAVAAAVPAVWTKAPAPRVKHSADRWRVEVTVFAKLGASGSVGPTTITLNPEQGAAILRTLDGLSPPRGLTGIVICPDDPVLYEIAVHPTHGAPFAVRGWRCQSTVREFVGGRRTTTFEDWGCTLLRVVKAVLPPHVAEGTRDAPCVRPRVPTVVGYTLSLAQKRLSAKSSTLQEVVTNQVVEPGVPPETVLTETPESWPSVPVTIAVPDASPCAADQLAVTFTGTRPVGTSEIHYTGLTVRDVSSQWCSVHRPIQVAGLDATGEPVTSTVTYSKGTTNPALDVLSPDTPPMPTTATGHGRSGDYYPVAVFYATISSLPGLCGYPPTNSGPLIAPAAWQVTLPGTVVLTAPTTGVRPSYGCQGTPGLFRATVRDGTRTRP